MRKLLASAAVVCAVLVAPGGGAGADPLPWPVPASPPLPPDPTVPYLPGVRTICPAGGMDCVHELDSILTAKTAALGCSHDAVFADAYRVITDHVVASFDLPGYWQRPDRLQHETRQYAQEYLDQYAAWHNPLTRSQSASAWAIAFQAAADGSVTGLGDLLLQLNAHIRRDNPIRAIEQSEGVLRTSAAMPGASGRPDHDQVSNLLEDTLVPMIADIAARYDPAVDDVPVLFGSVMDEKGLYALIGSWREEAWRNAEQLRHARALGPTFYQAKLAEIEASATAGALAIKAATLTTPQANAARDAYCAAHV